MDCHNEGAVTSIEKLIIDLKESLERELTSLRQEMRDGFSGLTSRLDTQSARLDRHAGLWQVGSRWSSRMDTWAEKVDSALDMKDREIADLRERIKRLENNASH